MKEETIRAFDSIAGSYDETVLSNEILRRMRETVHGIYLHYFKPGDKILELNSGTGIDALFLAEKGFKVFATDASSKMIGELKNKKSKGEIKVQVLEFSEINKIEESGFDGVVSNFGGLNCIRDFGDLSRQVALKLKPSGRFIAVVMNRICPWEIGYYLTKFNSKNAFRRFSRNGVEVKLNGNSITSFYFTPGTFRNPFEKYFAAEKIYTLGLFTPPPYLSGLYKRSRPLVELLMSMDRIVHSTFPFNRFGDHFVTVMKKREL